MNFEVENMSLQGVIVTSKDVDGDKITLSAVALVEFTTEQDLGACQCEVVLKVKFLQPLAS